jgi:hypothetical protein
VKKKAGKNTEPSEGVFWVVAVVAILLAAIYAVFYENTTLLLRSAAVTSAIVIPMWIWFLQSDKPWQVLLGINPDPISIALSGIAGLTVWPVAWWLMGIMDSEVLFKAFGAFEPPSLYLPTHLNGHWPLLVVTDTVIVPLALMALLWGGLRSRIAGWKVWQAGLIFGGVFGVYGATLYGQGVAGFLGYGLCGLVAGLLSLRAGIAWTGLATHSAFMYANLNFLDNLLRQMVHRPEAGGVEAEPYFGTKWLALVLISGLATLALLQIVRFRNESRTTEDHPPTTITGRHMWLTGAIIIGVFCFVLMSEIIRRAGSS